MHYFYILFSHQADRYYIGETSNLSKRLEKHNQDNHKSYTKIANDWEYVLTFKTDNRADALFLESFTKRMKSRKFIQKIANNQHILQDILKNR